MEEVMKTENVPEQASDSTEQHSEVSGEKKPGVLDKKEIRLALGALVLLVIAFLAWTNLQPKFIAARVNGSVISRAEVTAELERQGGSQVLESLISDRLVFQDAASKNVSVDQAAIDEELGNLMSQIEAQGQSFEEYLETQNFSFEYITNRIRLRLLMDLLLAEDIAVSEEEIDALIEENSAYLPEGTDTTNPELRAQVSSQIEQQKFNDSAEAYIEGLLVDADVQYVHAY